MNYLESSLWLGLTVVVSWGVLAVVVGLLLGPWLKQPSEEES